MTNEKDREKAIKLVENIFSTHGHFAGRDSWTRQLTKQELSTRRKDREDALAKVVLSYRTEAVKAERERCIGKLAGSGLIVKCKPITRDTAAAILSDDQEAAVCTWRYINGGYSSECGFMFRECTHDSNGVDICPHCRKPVKEEGRG